MNLENLNDPIESQPGEGAMDGEGTGMESEEPIGQPRKRRIDTAGLMLFGLILAVGAATYIMVIRAGNQTGMNNSTALAADGTITTFLSGGVQNLRQMIMMLHNTDQVVNQFNTYSTARQIPLKNLKTNPFRAFAEKPQAPAQLNVDAARRQQEQERENAETLARTLRLDSIVYGTHSGCMITGKSYAQGQFGEGFEVEQIKPESVIVKIGNLRYELRMPARATH